MLKVAERTISTQKNNSALRDAYIRNLDLLYSDVESPVDILRNDCAVFNANEGHIHQTDYITGRLREIASLTRTPNEPAPKPDDPLSFPIEYAKIPFDLQEYCEEIKINGLPKNSIWRPHDSWIYIPSSLKGTTNEVVTRNCRDLSKFATLVGTKRDQGSTEISMLRVIHNMEENSGQQGMKSLFRAIVRWAFSRKSIAPDLLASQIENSCVKSDGYGFHLIYSD